MHDIDFDRNYFYSKDVEDFEKDGRMDLLNAKTMERNFDYRMLDTSNYLNLDLKDGGVILTGKTDDSTPLDL